MNATRVLLVVVFLLFATAVQAEILYQEKIDFVDPIFVGCFNDGIGENVLPEGKALWTIREVSDASGGWHYGNSITIMGAAGYGETTGDKFRIAGSTTEVWSEVFPGCPSVSNFEANYRIIGQGKDNNARVHESYRAVLDPDCNLTIEKFYSYLVCQ